MKKGYRTIVAVVSLFLLVLIDQVTKFAAVKCLKGKEAFSLIPGVFELQYLENRGAAFGALQNQRWFFILIVIFVLAVLLWCFIRFPKEAHYRPLAVLAVFIAAGAIGNMIDRLLNGYVIDFLYFSLIDFPIFNVADIYVTVAMVVLFILILTIYKDDDFHFQKLFKDDQIQIQNTPIKASYRITGEEEIALTIPDAQKPDIVPENIPLDILYEDQDLLVVNKPKGMVVHPAHGHYSGTLVNALMYHCKDSLSGINGVLRPGIVHRIDMDTTGSLIVCKTDMAHKVIAAQLKEHSIHRCYRAIVHGVIKEDSGVIDAPIGRNPTDRKKMAINEQNGKRAVTHFKVLKRFRQFTYIECELETGRTHQIRVHMASLQHPLLGDSVYGPAKSPYKLQGQTLHAMTIGFIHPSTGEYMEFSAPLPAYFEELLHKLP